MPALKSITAFLDRALNIPAFDDESHNGLQVENSGRVTKICAAVDATLEFFQAAAERSADLLICHHGLSWNDSLKRITGLNYRRLKILLEHDMALYACHLPLDAHPALGNNAQICRALGLRRLKPFGLYRGRTIGFSGELPKPTPYAGFKAGAQRVFNRPLLTMDFGKATIRTVAVVSGGAADEIVEAAEKGMDVYLSGEPKLSAWHLAREHCINAVFAGHYATETFGVKAVAELLRKRFRVKSEFISLPTPL